MRTIVFNNPMKKLSQILIMLAIFNYTMQTSIDQTNSSLDSKNDEGDGVTLTAFQDDEQVADDGDSNKDKTAFTGSIQDALGDFLGGGDLTKDPSAADSIQDQPVQGNWNIKSPKTLPAEGGSDVTDILSSFKVFNKGDIPEGVSPNDFSPEGDNNTSATPEGDNNTNATPEADNNTSATPEADNNTSATPEEGSNGSGNTAEFLKAFDDPNAEIQPVPPEHSTFTYVDPETGELVDDVASTPFFVSNDALYAKYITIATQPPSFTALGLTNESIQDHLPESFEDFTKMESPRPLVTTTTGKDGLETERRFKMESVKADEYVFTILTLENPNAFEKDVYVYWFPFSEIANPKLIFREANEKCPLPEAKEPMPPVVKKCHWYYSRVEAIYEYYIKITNISEEGSLLRCICEGILKLKNQPSIELLCLEDALVEASHRLLTKEKYEHFTKIYTHDEGNRYFTNQGDQSVGEISFSDLTKEQIDAYENRTGDSLNVKVNDKLMIEDAIEKVQSSTP